MKHITSADLKSLELHKEYGDILTKKEVQFITNHLKICNICKVKFKIDNLNLSDWRISVIALFESLIEDTKDYLECLYDTDIDDGTCAEAMIIWQNMISEKAKIFMQK